MANAVNRRLDGPPTQGRARECARRRKQVAKELDRRLVDALYSMESSELAQLQQLDDAQTGYLEHEIARANLTADSHTKAVAQAILDAIGDDADGG
jgi:hypothetical protein